MPGLGRTQQVVLMMLLWGIILILIDKKFNEHPERFRAGIGVIHPQIELKLNHLCCSGCYTSVFAALKKETWLTNPTYKENKPLLTQEQVSHIASPGHMDPAAFSGRVAADIDPAQVRLIDLMQVPREIEKQGLVPEEYVLSGIKHFALMVKLPHLCCPQCKEAAGLVCDLRKQNALYEELVKLNSAQAIVEMDSITLTFKDQADIAQLLRILRRIGYMPIEIHILVLA